MSKCVDEDWPSPPLTPYVRKVRIDSRIIDSPDDWRLELTAATQKLLGDTIALTDQDWQVAVDLPGWSRAHIAAHLTHHARALAAMAVAVSRDHQATTWRSVQSDADLNQGARRGAVTLLEGLDESSADLVRAFEQMDADAWQTTLHTSQGPLPATAMVVDRLNQVVIHHIDLRLGFDFADLEPGLTRTLLRWNLFRAAPRFSQVELTVVSDEGLTAVVGNGAPLTVRGSEWKILGWLLGRKDSSAVLGTEGLDLVGPV